VQDKCTKGMALRRESHLFGDRKTLWRSVGQVKPICQNMGRASDCGAARFDRTLPRRTTHMKKKVSITLSTDVLARVDQLADSKYSRSAIIELVIQNYLGQREGSDTEARDLELINGAADRLNLEGAAVLDYQVIL